MQNIPAVVINLDRHDDRLSWFMSNALRIGLAVERIKAIDAQDPSVQELIESFRGHDQTLSKAEAGCYLSHRLAWQALLDSDSPYLAVFEDDAHLAQDLPSLLHTSLIPSPDHLIKLEVPSGKVSITMRPHASTSGRHYHRILTRAYGAGGYVVSRRCAQRLLDISLIGSQPVDVVLFDDESAIFKEFGVTQIVPAPCIQDVNLARHHPEHARFDSAIEAGRQETKHARKTRDKQIKQHVSFRKARRYLHCILNGANPLRYKRHIPFDLGKPIP